MTDIVMRRAGPHESAAVLSVLDEAAADLAARGIVQWPPAFGPEWIEPALGDGRVWLAEAGADVVGTLALTWSDALWPDDATAGYLHRFAVRRSAAGLGRRLLEWCDAAVGAQGRGLLRLDCGADNAALRTYYERAGFRHVDDVELPAGGPRLSRYQRSVRARDVRPLA